MPQSTSSPNTHLLPRSFSPPLPSPFRVSCSTPLSLPLASAVSPASLTSSASFPPSSRRCRGGLGWDKPMLFGNEVKQSPSNRSRRRHMKCSSRTGKPQNRIFDPAATRPGGATWARAGRSGIGEGGVRWQATALNESHRPPEQARLPPPGHGPRHGGPSPFPSRRRPGLRSSAADARPGLRRGQPSFSPKA